MERERETFAPSRRRLGALLAAGAAMALPGMPAIAGTGSDARLLTLEEQINRLSGQAGALQNSKITPFNDEFERRLAACRCPGVAEETAKAALASAFGFSNECGREAAIGEVDDLWSEADRLFEEAFAIAPKTADGRAAKVRLLIRCYAPEMAGPYADLDWEWKMTRFLLAEYAGVSQDELAAITPWTEVTHA